jgi:hypothetical protein
MLDVVTLTGGFSVNGMPKNGGTVVASFSNGNPIIIRRSKNGKNRVDLGVFPAM